MNSPPRRPSVTAIAAVTLLLALAAAFGWWLRGAAVPTFLPEMSREMSPPTPAAPATAERRVLYWYDPMYPQQHFDKPGKSPFMDMELVPRYADPGEAQGAAATGMRIDPALTQNLGMRVGVVARVPLATQFEASGLIGFDERAVAVVQSRAAGIVERVWPLAPGDLVAAGQALVELLIPAWAVAQREFLAVRAIGDPTLTAAARQRLQLLGMTAADLEALERSGIARARFTLVAPRAGVVQTLDMRAGMAVARGATIARINGLAKVWLEVAVPEAQAGAVAVGASATVRLTAWPDQPVQGRVTAILPALDQATRSLRVRVELPNPAGELRPGLSAQVELRSQSTATALAVPTEAVIRTGKRTLVMVAEGGGRYRPVEVEVGREAGEQTFITQGLAEGQQVVVSGQFLLDSEASLRGITGDPPSAPGATLPGATLPGAPLEGAR